VNCHGLAGLARTNDYDIKLALRKAFESVAWVIG
jgi:hypothetical protein